MQKKFYTFSIIIIVLVLTGASCNNKKEVTENDLTIKQDKIDEISSTENTASSTKEKTLSDEEDEDHDGLNNLYEKESGTDPLTSDSDNDDLADGDEVKIWKTDPLKYDSDGDGYSDGEEIKNGYNPLGSGKLLKEKDDDETPNVTTNTTTTVKTNTPDAQKTTTPVKCTSMECLKNLIKTCSKGDLTFSSSVPFPLWPELGIIVYSKTYYKISGKDSSQLCVLTQQVLETKFSISDEGKKEAINNGTTAEEIDEQLKMMNEGSNEPDKLNAITTCTGKNEDILSFLEKSIEGNIDTTCSSGEKENENTCTYNPGVVCVTRW